MIRDSANISNIYLQHLRPTLVEHRWCSRTPGAGKAIDDKNVVAAPEVDSSTCRLANLGLGKRLKGRENFTNLFKAGKTYDETWTLGRRGEQARLTHATVSRRSRGEILLRWRWLSSSSPPFLQMITTSNHIPDDAH